MLTTAQFNTLNQMRRFTAQRLLIKKTRGITIPGITTDFPATIDKFDGGGYPAPNTAGEDYKQIVRDTGNKRNRTIILHNNQMSELYNAVISIIDHKTDTIYSINRSNSTGWPSTYNIVPDNILFDEKANKLYISVPALASKNPLVCVIDCELTLPDEPLQNCYQVAEVAEADRWACTQWDAGTALTRGTVTTYPTDAAARSHYKIICKRGGNLYCFYQSNQLNIYIGEIGTSTSWTEPYFKPNNFGYFTPAGVYVILWTWGTTNDHANVNTMLTEHNMGTISNGNYLTGYGVLTSWDYRDSDGHVTLLFTHPYMSLSGWGFGNEPLIMELSIDDCYRQWDVGPLFGSIHHKSGTFGYIDDLGHLGKFIYYQTGHSSAMQTNFDYKYTLDADAANACHQMAVYITWEYKNGAPSGSDQYLLRIETAAHGVHSAKPSDVPFSAYEASAGAVHYMDVETGNCHKIVTIDPKDPWIRVVAYKSDDTNMVDNLAYNVEIDINIYIRPHPLGCISMSSVLSPTALAQSTDSGRPAPINATAYPSYLTNGYMTASDSTVDGGEGATVDKYTYLSAKTIIGNGAYFYLTTDNIVNSGTATAAGLYIINSNGVGISRLLTTNSDLANNNIYLVSRVDKTGESGSFLVVSSPALPTTTNNIQLFDTLINAFAWDGDSADAAIASPLKSIEYNGSFSALCNIYEIWVYKPGWTTSTDPRTIREWWDGTSPDLILGAGPVVNLSDDGRIAGIEALSFSHAKGEASYELQFGVSDVNYLPWVASLFNENLGAPGTYTGTLEDGNCILFQRGVLNDNNTWTWLDECQTFIVSEPTQAQEGIASMRCTCKGIIGNILTRSIYEYTHEPTATAVAAGVLTADATEKIYTYLVDGDVMTDWATSPEVTVYVDGVKVYDYTLNTGAGSVTFETAMTGKVITADFTYYVPGTNEAEDIIICILRQANEKGGPGLDDTYFTDYLTGETLTTADHLTYSFSKNNLRNPDTYNAVYVDGVLTTAGVTWDYRDGTVTFDADKSANVITGDCIYFTIQKSDITLRKIVFNAKTQNSAYDCINEVVRRVTPNYIFHEAANGKLICDFYTQKADGLEDISIDGGDIVLTNFADNPAYYGIANWVISYGQAPLSELPNRCSGRTVTNLWPYAWHAGVDFQSIVDGNPETQITAGYGRWSQGTLAVCNALEAADPTGIPMVSIDMETAYEIETIIVARGAAIATEGDGGSTVTFSIWISSNGTTWRKIVDRFNIAPGANIQFKAGTNYDEGTSFRYIRINMHSIGLYQWKGHTDSQMNLSEVQCYETEIIRGEAKLQNTDPTAVHYDTWGMLEKYGYLMHRARNGQPDPALYTQSAVDGDASDVLNEMMRLLSQVQADSPYLPGVPLFSTIKIYCPAMQRTATMFVETKSITDGGDSLTGSNYP
jgi:hypothetical protein